MPLLNEITNGSNSGYPNKPMAQAAAWTLRIPSNKPVSPESAIIADHGGHDGPDGTESIFYPDERDLVEMQDILDGGRYRYTTQAIVKIQSCFEDPATKEQVWMMGTGWLIRPDLLVTAGHVVFDYSLGYRATVQIKCYIGYNGRDSVKGPTCQPRYGQRVITTGEWSKEPNRAKDVAFIQVARPFEGNLNLFSYVDTPVSDQTKLNIVGYPGDKSLGDENGAQMYELSKTTDYNLKDDDLHMIHYRISTYGGQSGAPILRRKNGTTVSIGTHCYGGGGNNSNSGNSIGGQWGNPYSSFVGLFSNISAFGVPGNIKYIDLQSTSGNGGSNPSGEEGFLDVLKTVAKVGASVLPMAGGVFGPIGGAVGTAAGAILGAVSEAALMGPESAMSEGTLMRSGVAERAMLAEASLQAVLSLPGTPESQQVIQHMSTIWNNAPSNVDLLAKALAPQISATALSLAVNQLPRSPTSPGQEAFMGRRSLNFSAGSSESSIIARSPFEEGLFAPTKPVAGEEGVFDWLGDALKGAVAVATPLVSQAAKAAITNFGPKLVDKVLGSVGGGSESLPVQVGLSKEAEVKLLLKRALMADTALQALRALPKEKLDALLATADSQGQTEGIFDSIKNVVQKYGPTVLNLAKDAVKTYAPVIVKVVTDKLTEDVPMSPLPVPIIGGQGGLRKARSIYDIISDPSVSQPLSEYSKQAIGQEQDALMSSGRPRSGYQNPDAPPLMTQPPPDFPA
ncbi:hypothetical protein QM012_000966 [Aureobasidium pullulans]|uniref:Serine protease n=1 Tax=Aureobasidium pullulans TaxID=5580 RepID=A0ABR0TFA8_AURPU